MVDDVQAEPEIALVKFWPNLSLARRIAIDIDCNDAYEVHRAIQRRCPGVLHISVKLDEMSREAYEDLCYAIESEMARSRGGALKLV